ncbi:MULTISPECIES: hypothetical protein [Candidatus Fukatsuia]|nr:hypothetical protein [Candidatus Fukatsuia symbiotica]
MPVRKTWTPRVITPTHKYKKATQEQLAIPNVLARQFTVAAPN